MVEADSEEELRAEILEDLAKEEIGDLVVERDGQIVGAFQIVPVELRASTRASRAQTALRCSAGRRHDPDVRGSGAGLALTEAAFAWARERGHETMVTDWRVTNLLSSRFWPARGFRPTFLRLLPAHPVVPRIPILSGSRIAVVNVPEDAVVLRPPPPSEAIATSPRPSATRSASRSPARRSKRS